MVILAFFINFATYTNNLPYQTRETKQITPYKGDKHLGFLDRLLIARSDCGGLSSNFFVFYMDNQAFLDNILPGNYFITKSMELTKSSTSGTLWYTKKFVVLYYYIFLKDNITTLADVEAIKSIFDNFIASLPANLQDTAKKYFYASEDVADLRSEKFKLFQDFAGSIAFSNDNEKISYYESAKKYYFAFLMESGGQSGVKAHIKSKIYEEDFSFNQLESIISEYARSNGYNTSIYSTLDKYVCGMKNDYMAFIRNERQILFYYGFFHSKSSGANDREFSSLTPIGELALKGNFYELIVLWEHQKVKMVSQPVNIEIKGLKKEVIDDFDKFSVNNDPYLTILKSLLLTGGFSKETYQYIISRIPKSPQNNIDISDAFLEQVKLKVARFRRKGDVETEDFTKEILKYFLGIRSDLPIDSGTNPLGLCSWTSKGVGITDKTKLMRLVSVYTTLCEYKNVKYSELLHECAEELKGQYIANAYGQPYTINSKIKINWDMYNIHSDLLIMLSISVILIEMINKVTFKSENISSFVSSIKEVCPNILANLGLKNTGLLKKELRQILSVLEEGKFEMYLEDSIDDYDKVYASYLNESLQDLEQKIKENSNLAPVYVAGVRKRNTTLIGLIKSYNLQKFSPNGELLNCECCANPTFLTFKNESYVEYHHLIPFSEFDGPDHSLNIIALCPMCHRKLHFLKQEDKKILYNNISENNYSNLSIENRLRQLFEEHRLKSYQLEFLLADNAIDEEVYNRILNIA